MCPTCGRDGRLGIYVITGASRRLLARPYLPHLVRSPRHEQLADARPGSRPRCLHALPGERRDYNGPRRNRPFGLANDLPRQLRQFPNVKIGFGIWRHDCTDEASLAVSRFGQPAVIMLAFSPLATIYESARGRSSWSCGLSRSECEPK